MRRALFASLCTAASALRVAPDAKRLILVRHGAVDRRRASPQIKPDGFYGGNVGVPLSDVGEAEALAAAKLIAEMDDIAVEKIWSSPMKRALFGARATGHSARSRGVGEAGRLLAAADGGRMLRGIPRG